MAWQEVKYQLISSCPLIPHNGQTADPLNKWSKLLKPITSKKKKTDADFEEIARIEFFSGLYLDANGPVIPTFVIDSLIVNAAKKSREGITAKSAVFCLEHARLEYDGPRTAAELWAIETFRYAALVRVGQNRVMRMRPIFNEWSSVVTLNLENTLINPARVDEWMTVAGTQVGLCERRPQYGRFTAKRIVSRADKEKEKEPELVMSGNGRR